MTRNSWVPQLRIHGLPGRSRKGLLSTSPLIPAPFAPPGPAFSRSSHSDSTSPPVECPASSTGALSVSCADGGQGATELGVVVEREVGDVVRRLAGAARAPALAQVEGEEREPVVGEEVGEGGLEEVVGEPVHVEDGADRVLRRLATHERADDLALAVGILTELQHLLLVPVAQDVRLPVGHAGQNTGGLTAHPEWAP